MDENQWEEVSSRVRVVLNYGVVQKEQLQSSRMARFIAAVPFLAGCKKAMETSFVHLLTYSVALDEAARDVFIHKPDDDADIYTRLTPLLSFSGGDERILQCSRDLIAICMVSNYIKDAEADRMVGKYNPVAAGTWNADEIIEKLVASVNASITPAISGMYTVEEAIRGGWKD